MEIRDKLRILSDAAKYDASCSSSGSERSNTPGGLGNAASCGICHSFSADGRCISLLKILLSNYCVYDCQYCINRSSNDVERAAFTPREAADLTVDFYKRNYIEGLFLSSAVTGSPDNTMEQLIKTLSILRNEYKFNGYIHVKTIPGAAPGLVNRLGLLCDRMSVNIELPSDKSLSRFAPQKTKESILKPMKQIQGGIIQSKNELALYRHAPTFTPAGQSTQMIVGATGESDKSIIRLSQGLYKKFDLKRVFYSAYIPIGTNPALPTTAPPLLREHRLYQADWLMRFYHFSAEELLEDDEDSFSNLIDPKCQWALRHMEYFPAEINSAPYELLLRVPGIGVRSALKIVKARRFSSLGFEDLKKMRVSLKRAKYFITAKGKTYKNIWLRQELITPLLLSENGSIGQMSLLDEPTREDGVKCLTGEM
ncbi:MAG: putative DNA modification/repair radical SAM protein [Clostridiales bacterium]|nr:putative DNA modification/repair radical SAM protein [Clostridiales bacterium]